MIASLLILIGMGAITVSCRKDKTNSRKAELITQSDDEKSGDEDPIIRVRVKKKQSLIPVGGALVETMTYGTDVRVNSGYTDSLGQYDRQVPPDVYYFKVTVSGNVTPYVTDTVRVNQDTQATILVD